MKKSILIIGITGVGKSTLARYLQEMGYEAYSIEDIDRMFEVYRKGTRKVFEGYDINNPNHVDDSEWICHIDQLKELLSKQKSDKAFYLGVGSNMEEILLLFDKVILLKVSDEKLRERLQNREGKEEEMGNTEKTRQRVFRWKDWWEGEMERRGAISINADSSTKEIANKVLEIT